MTTHDRSRLAWTLADTPSGERELQLVLDPVTHRDPDALASIEEARVLTNRRARGWLPLSDGDRATLPWHPNLTPSELAWVWIRLLQRYAIAPDLVGPRAGGASQPM